MSQIGRKFNVFLAFPTVIQIIRYIREQDVSVLNQSHVTFCCKISFHKKHAPFYLFVIRFAFFDNLSIKKNVSYMWYWCYVNLFHTHFSGKHPLIILVIFLEQRRRVQTVRAFALAVSAVQAVLDLFHLLLHFFCELQF